jgi:hypothetical protein
MPALYASRCVIVLSCLLMAFLVCFLQSFQRCHVKVIKVLRFSFQVTACVFCLCAWCICLCIFILSSLYYNLINLILTLYPIFYMGSRLRFGAFSNLFKPYLTLKRSTNREKSTRIQLLGNSE